MTSRLPRLFWCLATLGLASAATSQQVLVVNGAGGTPFQSVQAAIDAAVAGDIVRIRSGTYAAFTCSKPIRIEGEAGVIVQETATASVAISGIGAGQSLAMSRIRLAQFPGPTEAFLSVSNCAGVVLLDAIGNDPASLPPRLIANQVAALLVADSVLGPLRLTDSTASLTNCRVESSSLDLGAVVQLYRSVLDLTDGHVSVRLNLGGAGFELNDSQVRLRFVQGLSIAIAPSSLPVIEFDIRGGSRVDYHTFVTPPNPTVLGGPFYRSAASTSLRAATAGPGATVSIDVVRTSSTGAAFVLLSTPVTPYSVPQIRGQLFVGGGFLLNLGLYSLSLGLATVPLHLPPNPGLQGFPVVVQGVTSDFEVTNASGFTLR